MDKYVFGPSTGDTGQYGIGDLVEGTIGQVGWDEVEETFTINGEPVYHVNEIRVAGDGGMYVDVCDVRDFRPHPQG